MATEEFLLFTFT